MQIFDTLRNMKAELEFSDKVRIYLCGVTVYDDAHIGHARTIIIFDVLRRFLESQNIPVELVQNFTDVDDKIIKRAQKDKTPSLEIIKKYTKNYFDDFDRLNVKRATIYPKAREHIPDMLDLIKNLKDNGYAYVKKEGEETGVYFSIPSLRGRVKKTGKRLTKYGKLSKKTIKELVSAAKRESQVALKENKKKMRALLDSRQGMNVITSEQPDVKELHAEIDKLEDKVIAEEKQKDEILDFALWKFSDFSVTWDSPWGKGRPGWHIECSAMSLKYLGENFEIHGGGRDLIFPHHENEIAQSESMTLKHFAKIWMHVGMVTIDKVKMSKSLGNVKTVRYVFENWGSNIIRLFCLSGHYTKPIDYSEKLLKENITKLRQIESCYYELRLAEGTGGDSIAKKLASECKKEFDSTLNDDLNTPLALTAFYKLIKGVNSMAADEKITQTVSNIILPEFERMTDILGIQILKISDEEKNEINQLIIKRNEYREQKNFEEADRIREQIIKKNIIFVDHKNSTRWIKQEKIKAE